MQAKAVWGIYKQGSSGPWGTPEWDGLLLRLDKLPEMLGRSEQQLHIGPPSPLVHTLWKRGGPFAARKGR